MKVFFIGAGPGDPELITIKGVRILKESPVCIYAGSLVNKSILSYLPMHCHIVNSAELNLQEIGDIFLHAFQNNKNVARLHTGDPSLYSAIHEQMLVCNRYGISYEVIPGVSSFSAAAAAIQKQLTLPGVTQTVILSRIEGRTPVPERERLSQLAAIGATLCIFLSISLIDSIVNELKMKCNSSTPVVVVYKASWPDQIIIFGTLETISLQVKQNGINKTAMILVGDVLTSSGELSKLYDESFSHAYRKGSDSDTTT